MQRVSSMLPSWDKTKTGSKKGFDKAWGWADKLGAPVNRLSNKIGSEAFWPTTLDKESDKAARILKSFCKDGFYAEEDRPATVDVPKGKQRVLKKIPEKVIQNAVGLAIFTTMRTGLWVSGAGGSGVLIARKEDGSWSPPSGILLHTAGLGFLVGVDIYDCVVVINNRKALDAFTKIRATLGGEISAVAGPVGVGGVLENDGKWKQANRPVFTYLKSRGFYAGVQVDGTVIIERNDENERFYGERIGVADILAGKARHPPYEIKMLMETVKAAEGRSDVDVGMMLELADQPAPGDVDVEAPGSATSTSFGIPEPDDPDPFGVLALEKAGLDIKEAGTKSRPVSSAVFEYNPSPTSPIYGRFHRRSMDTLATRSNRESYMSTRSSRTTYRTSIDRATQTMEMGTQTDDAFTPNTSPSHSDEDKRIVEEDEKHAVVVPESEPVDYTKIDMGEFENMGRDRDVDGPIMNDSPRERADSDTRAAATMDDSFHTDDDDELDEEEPVIYEAASAQATVVAPQAINARGGIVNIAKRPPPPPLPPRSVARGSHILMVDQASGRTPTSPAKEGFEQVAVHGNDRSSKDLGRSSKELENGITMEDLEDMEDKFSKTESVRISTPIIIEPESGNRFKTDSSGAPEAAGSKLSKDEDETDDFHSVPTTPLEANTNGTRI